MQNDPQASSRKCACKARCSARVLGALLALGLVAALAFHLGRDSGQQNTGAVSGAKLAAQAGDDIPTLYPR
jgi:hypothetical protein